MPTHRPSLLKLPPALPSQAGWVLRSAAVMAAAMAFMAISGWLYLPWWELAFRSDNSPVSWLSAALLLAASVLALRLAADGSLPRVGGRVLSAALLLLALDEQFMFHERFKYRYLAASSPFGDSSTVAVALGGLVLLALFMRRVRGIAPRVLLVSAIGVGEFALLVDLAGSHVWPLLSMLEEGCEVLSEALFVCALMEVRPAQVQSSSRSS